MAQTYQQLSEQVVNDLRELRKNGITKLQGFDIHRHFFDLKVKTPERYERMTFDLNGAEPYSSVLGDILSDLRVWGCLRVDYDVIDL